MKKKFTLELRRWYAMDYLFASGEWHHSPIWIEGIEPGKTGKGWLMIKFWHANYPGGVQGKEYEMRVLRREEGYLLAEREPKGEGCPLILTAITRDWFCARFPGFDGAPSDAAELQAWLSRKLKHG